MTDRIGADHSKRAALVYVRQSKPEQVRRHAESTEVARPDAAWARAWAEGARRDDHHRDAGYLGALRQAGREVHVE